MKNNIIAVYGNSNSGKTTLSIQLAKSLLKNKAKSIIVIGSEENYGYLSQIIKYKDEEKNKSIGNVLHSDINDKVILNNLCEVSKNIYTLGYNNGESYSNYGFEKTDKKLKKLISIASSLADYVIIDCSSDINNNELSLLSLQIADVVINNTTVDNKGANYYLSTNDDLKNIIGESKVITVANKVNRGIIGNFDKVITTLYYKISFSDEIFDRFEDLEISKYITDKQYNKSIQQICNDIISYDKNEFLESYENSNIENKTQHSENTIKLLIRQVTEKIKKGIK